MKDSIHVKETENEGRANSTENRTQFSMDSSSGLSNAVPLLRATVFICNIGYIIDSSYSPQQIVLHILRLTEVSKVDNNIYFLQGIVIRINSITKL